MKKREKNGREGGAQGRREGGGEGAVTIPKVRRITWKQAVNPRLLILPLQQVIAIFSLDK